MTRGFPLALLCAAAIGNSGCAIGRAINTCPAPIEYSDGFLNAAADELDALPEGSKVGQMIVDYRAERDKLRACRK